MRWNEYFLKVDENIKNVVSVGATLYPTHILFMDFGEYYAMELVGARQRPGALRQKIAKYKSVYDYWDPFHGNLHEPLFKVGTGEKNDPRSPNGFSNLSLAHECDIHEAKLRFGHLNTYQSSLVRKGGKGSIFEFGPGFGSMYLQQCSVLNHDSGIFRSRNIMFHAMLERGVKLHELNGFFDGIFNLKDGSGGYKVAGVLSVSPDDIPIIEASLLQNLYLSSGVLETTIDGFLADHPSFLKDAFSSGKVIYNTNLKWMEHDGSVEDRSIKPDVFVQRSDGFYDIVDLKLAALSKPSLTKAKRSRRRFIDYVGEGLAQLANYEFYFSFSANRTYAKQVYGIEVNNPHKTLVVGSMENTDHQEITEALRAYGRAYSILDYDTIVSRYLKK